MKRPLPMRALSVITLAFSMLILAGCTGGQAATPTFSMMLSTLPASGSAAAGEAIFQGGVLGKDLVACSACHSISGAKMDGPSLAHIATAAAARQAGQTAEEYLFTAIVYPNQVILPGYTAGRMPADYGQKLTPQQIRDVINYLLTLN